MNALAKTLLATSISLALAQHSSLAEDIDIYGSSTSSATNPNILIIIDNSANWDAANQHWPGGIKQGQSELNALRTLAAELTNDVNVGLMLFTEGTTANNPNGPGGYVRYKIRQMTDTNKNALRELIGDASCTAGNNSLNGTPNCLYKNFSTPAEKVGSAKTDYSAVMFEAFKYFGGYTSPLHANDNVAGTPTDASHFGAYRYSGSPDTKSDAAAYEGGDTKPRYETPISDDNNCAKNYVIFIGNGFPSQDSPSTLLSGVGGDTSQVPLADYTTSTTTTNTTLTTTTCGAYSSATACAGAAWSTTYPGYDAYSCTNQTNCAGGKKFDVIGSRTTTTATATGTSTVPTGNTIRYADEWARFLNRTDVSAAAGQQNVKTYTIDVYKDQQDLNETALLRSMALAGGGKYYVAQDESAILNALRKIISEIQSVNSVFASSSLPVSVNTQGTYLNQVFIGMFRPDGGGQPRWAGNLKQYQFAFFADQLKLADKNKNEAISATTGFMTPCAQSFWTTDSGTYWDYPTTKAKGSCLAVPSQFPSAGSSSIYSDAPDGDVVEKGGAAQRLRGEGSSGGTLTTSTTNYATRVLKTCDGSSATSCTSLTNFDTSNATLVSTLGSTLIDWVRGKDNFEDENGNFVSTEMRPSTLGDVVHSQPAAVDYGGSTGVVVFYGANDGVFHAINGNKASDTDGNELWGFVAPETFGRLNRLRNNEPRINLPGVLTTITPTPIPKDYFFDGSAGVFQRKVDDSSQVVWIYPTMRRGGRAIYAFDVSTPTSPTLKWRRGCFTSSTTDDTSCSASWTSIGQTWSKPQIGYLNGYVDNSTPPKQKPVLVFGGGYDTCEDTNSQTRCTTTPRKGANIWFVDADTGDIIRTYPTNYSVPGEVVLLKDDNGNITYAYAADSGGYVYRVNVGTYDGTTTSGWTDNAAASNITIASLSETNQARKFLNGLDVVEYATYNAVLVGSGDREHPMIENYPCGNFSTAAGNFVTNAFYMIKDVPSAYPGSPRTPADLTDVTDTTTATAASIGTGGWYFRFNACEQTINKSITIGGTAYFGTNQPNQQVPGSCTNNLGTARGYAVDFITGNPVSGTVRSAVFAGGGLPPSPVAGVVEVDGQRVPFLLGGAKPGDASNPNPSPLEGQKVPIDPKGARTRVYWYIQGD